MSWELPVPSFIRSAWEESMTPPFWRGKLRPREAKEMGVLAQGLNS